MYNISLFHNHEKIKRYKSNILPLVGDIYSSGQMDDGHQRIVIGRNLFTDEEFPDLIVVVVDYSFPELVKLTQNDK